MLEVRCVISYYAIMSEVKQSDNWEDMAACSDYTWSPDVFFRDKDQRSIEIAKSICRRCPVVEQCLKSALENNEIYGVWGGTTPKERRRLRRFSDVALRGVLSYRDTLDV